MNNLWRYKRNNKPYIRIIFLILILLIVLAVVIKLSGIKPKNKVPIVVLKSITAEDAYKRGMDIINHVWEYNSAGNGNKQEESVIIPGYLKNINRTRVCGIPYCWGGYLSTDKSNSSYADNFDDAIKKGYTAGNVHCSGKYIERTAGLDCSGFVSAVFDLPDKCSTKTMYTCFDEISFSDLKPMDILNSEGKHCYVYLGKSQDGKGIITMEASVDRSIPASGKTLVRYRSSLQVKKSMLLEGYKAMRYKKLISPKNESFQDKYEYNNTPDMAAYIKKDLIYRGTIDYIEDKDYYFMKSTDKRKMVLEIDELSKTVEFSLTDLSGKELLKGNKPGKYSFNLTKGGALICFKQNQCEYRKNGKEGYAFILK